jgi:alkylation response protein AidB-like acyl-CoA dehydrogenase
MRLSFDEQTEAFRAEFAAWLDEHMPDEATALAERSRSTAHLPAWARAWQRTLFDAGWLVPGNPPEYGGRNASLIEVFVHQEEMGRRHIYPSFNPQGLSIIAPSLLVFGTEEQKQRWAVPVLRGDKTAALGMSEPDAGSNVAGIRTRAERDGDEWVVNGQKIWTSGAFDADWCYVIARTDPDARPHEGLSELVVDMRSPGITVEPILDMTGSRHFCEVFFEDVRVPAGSLVGELNGSFRQVMRQMEHERGGIDRLVSNRRLYDDVRPLADTADPLVRQEIATIETGYRIGRLMVLRETLGQGPTQFSAATKTFCTELEQRIAGFCGNVLGARAMLDEPGLAHRVSRNICYAPGYTIMGGTTQILRNILGERTLGLPREPRPS